MATTTTNSAATYTPIAWTLLGSAASSITFSSIPAGYTDLRIVVSALLSSGDGIYSKFNGLSSGYSSRYIYGNGTAASSSSFQSTTQFALFNNILTGTSQPAIITLDVFQYANTGVYKTILFSGSDDKNGSGDIQQSVGLLSTTAAITSFTISPATTTFAAGTTAALYGIKAA